MTLPDAWKSRIVCDSNGCWLWTGVVSRDGYAQAFVNKKGVALHREVYSRLVEEIPTGLEIDHLCRVRNCLNPEHMEPVTHAENMRRYSETKTHCPQGHEYTQENTILDKRKNGRVGKRCRTCYNAYQRRRYEEKKRDTL